MVTPSLGQEITAALVLAQMVLTVDASLPVAAIKILLLYSLHVSVILDTSVPDVTTVLQASLAILQKLGGCVSLAIVTTTLTRQTQKPVTRRLGGASSACTIQKGSTASSADLGITGTPSSRTVGSVSAITWAPCRSTVTALTASVKKPLASACVFLMWLDRTVTTVRLIPGSWPAGLGVTHATAMLLIPSGHLVMSSQDSASACLGSEAAPAASARSSSGETPAWSAEPVTVTPGVLRRHSVTSPPANVSASRVSRVHAVTSALEGTRGSSLTALPATSALLFGT